jgi:hypothetical protein
MSAFAVGDGRASAPIVVETTAWPMAMAEDLEARAAATPQRDDVDGGLP